ncbi:MAG: DUF6600 domain-containing protein [Candidatus Aminicenantaceae bacterium]
MKKCALFTVSLILFFSWAAAQDDTYYDNSYARMSHVSGDTYVQRAQDLGNEAGSVNLAVISGDTLGTREGRLEIHFGQQNFLRMGRLSQVDVIQLPSRNLDYVKLHLKSGEVFLRISYLGEAQGFELHTQDASFYVLEEGLYRIRTGQVGETELRVIEGSMEAAGENASEVVRALERLVAAEGRIILGPTPLASRYADAFSDWNRSRDALLAKPASTYLPEELSPYEGELAAGGQWAYESPYGYVWVPQVYHDTWRPYSYGRWVWYPIIGYTWVSSYSWGWCVTHYGRWQWRIGLGWYWIPRSGWGPAWVHWYHGVNHYGWSALSYHGYPGAIINNHYYGDRYYGSYPADSRTMVTVRKDQLQNPNISRVALSQGQARSMGKVQLSSRQPASGLAAGTSRTTGMERVSSKSSLKTYSRSSTSRVSTGSVSRNGNTASSGRSVGSTARTTGKTAYPSRSARSGSSTTDSSSPTRASQSSTARNSRTMPQTYPSRSSVSAGRTTIAPRASNATRAAPQTYPSRSSSLGRSTSSQGQTSERSTRTYSSRTTRGVTQQNYASSVRGTPSRTTGSASRSSSGSVSQRSSSRSQSVRTAPRSATANSSPSRSASSYQSRGSTSSRSVPRSSSSSSRGVTSSSSRSSRPMGTTTRSSSASRTSSSRSSSSVRSSPSRSSSQSRGSSGRTASASRSSSSSRSGSRVRKR